MVMRPTERLHLVPLTRRLIEATLGGEGAVEREYVVSGQRFTVSFPEGWAGDAVAMFPGALRRLAPAATEAEASFVVVSKADSTAIGFVGVKGNPDENGAQEIGYAFIPASWGHGFATEAVRALTKDLLARPSVRAVVADTAVGNVASQRVLEKVGFVRTGTAWNAEDGPLIRWRCERDRLSGGAGVQAVDRQRMREEP